MEKSTSMAIENTKNRSQRNQIVGIDYFPNQPD